MLNGLLISYKCQDTQTVNSLHNFYVFYISENVKIQITVIKYQKNKVNNKFFVDYLQLSQ